ncbi:MAG: FecR domain-containing protein [Bdellovibrio sp.]|nr:FecR domain-containing protein [Bdellovibrio sp.]
MASLDSNNPIYTKPRGSTLDTVLLLLSASFSVLFLFLLLIPDHEIDTVRQTAGILLMRSNVVKIRQDHDWAWFEGQAGDKIHAGDLIFTHANSRATVDLSGGEKIKLNSNTLIKIAKSEDSNTSEIEIQKGIIEATMAQNGPVKKELSIKFKGKSYLLHSSGKNKTKLQFKSENKGGELFVLEGSAELKTGKGNILINSSNRINITGDGKDSVEKMSVVPVAPLNEETLVLELGRPHHVVKLKWQSHLSEHAEAFHLKIGTDPTLTTLVYSNPVTGHEYSFVPEGDGTYYWQIAQKEEKTSGPILSFNVFANDEPDISLNPAGPDYSLDDHIICSFQNMSQSLKLQYHLAIEGQNLEEHLTSNDGVFNYSFPRPGMYIFKARKEFNGYFSKEKTTSVNVNNFEMPMPPEIATPQDGQIDLHMREKSDQKGPNAIIISLVKPVPKYGLEVSLLAMKDKKEYFLRSEDDLTMVKLSAFDKYQIKARNYLKTHPNIVSPWSKAISYQVKELTRPNALPENGTRIELEKPSEKVTFSWKAPNKEDLLTEELLNTTYLFEIDDNPEFSGPDQQVTLENTTHFSISVDHPGIYYWRTKIITTTGEVLYSTPKKVEISPIPPPPAIEIQDLKLKIKFNQTRSPSLLDRFLQFMISSSYAASDENRGYVEISWPENKNAEYYLLQIFQDSNDQTPLIEKKLKQNTFIWEAPPSGIFYYRIAIIDFWQRQGSFGRLAKIEIEYDEKDLVAPDIELKQSPAESQIEGDETVYLLKIGKRISSVFPSFFQISKSSSAKSFDHPLIEKKVKASEGIQLKKKDFEPGKYFYRSVIKDAKTGQVIRSSPVSFFTIEKAASIPPIAHTLPEAMPPPELMAPVMSEKANESSLSYGPSKINLESQNGNKKATVDGIALKTLALHSQHNNLTIAGPFDSFHVNFFFEQGQVFSSDSYLRSFLNFTVAKSMLTNSLELGPLVHLESMTYFDNVSGLQEKKTKSLVAAGASFDSRYYDFKFNFTFALGLATIFKAHIKYLLMKEKIFIYLEFERMSFSNSGSEISYQAFRPQLGLTFFY